MSTMVKNSDCLFFLMISHIYSRIVEGIDVGRFEIEEYHVAAWSTILVKLFTARSKSS